MNRITFESDYIEGAHPKVLEALMKTNMEQLSGYGDDRYCESAAAKIKKACEKKDAQVRFLVGGTQTNTTIISTMLHRTEGVISADTGHVSSHEAGAIEHSGHKVLTVPSHEGKIDSNELRQFLKSFFSDGNREHMVYPGMVYISHPTEYGTLYSKSELEQISEICKEFELTFFLDGARLGYGLMSLNTDVTLEDIAELTDVFYIGGTKVGALCGEAVVFTHNNMPKRFTTMTKQQGALLAKGRLLGVQFDALFTDDLYFEISKNAIDKAEKLKRILEEAGIEFFMMTDTNQQFVVLEDEFYEKLVSKVGVSFWEKRDASHTVVRFATSWATTDEKLDELRRILAELGVKK